MNFLKDFVNKYKYRGVALSNNELMVFTMNLLKESDRLEKLNTGTPGKAAIEYLINAKYSIIENRNIDLHEQDQLLEVIDKVLDKVAKKYKVTRKKNQFIFDEEFVITHPDCAINKEQMIVCKIHAEQAELEALRIQLARTTLQNIQTFALKDSILQKEKLIRHLKRDLQMLKYFSDWGCSSISNLKNVRIGDDTMVEQKLSEKVLNKFNALTGSKPSMSEGKLSSRVLDRFESILELGTVGKAIKQTGKDINRAHDKNPLKTGAKAGALTGMAVGAMTGGVGGAIRGTVKGGLMGAGVGALGKLGKKAVAGVKNKAAKYDAENKKKDKLSARVLDRFESILELNKKAAVAGGAAGAVAGNAIGRHKAVKDLGYNKQALKSAKDYATRAGKVAKDQAARAKEIGKGGLIHKIKNAGTISRANKVAKNAKNAAKTASSTYKAATAGIRKAGAKAGWKGAAIGAAAGLAGAAYLKHRANKSKGSK